MLAAAALLAACEAPLSTLQPAGPSAAAIARLWWVMLAGAVAILLLVLGLLAYAFRRSDREIPVNARTWLIGGGLLFPGATLSVLLAFSLLTGERMLPHAELGAQPPVAERAALTVEATARQWEWGFRYPDQADAEASPVLVIPVGEDVHVRVASIDVIHSFWIPRLAGKIDAIPGYVNLIRLRADEPGTYLGQCAEFCGLGHAWMSFQVEAVPAQEFAAFMSGDDAAIEIGSATR